MDQYESKLKRIQNSLALFALVVGILLSVLAIVADDISLDLTPGFGMVQMFGLLLGVTSCTLAAFMFLRSRKPAQVARSLQADIGVRLAATGLVFLYITGFADLIGIGTHVNPAFERPFVGPLQLGGLILGFIAILVGLFLYHTSRGRRKSSSMNFLLNNKQDTPPST